MQYYSLFCRAVVLICVSLLICVEGSIKDSLSDDQHLKEGEHNTNYDHDAFLGQDHGNDFMELTPDESKQRLGKLIPKIDKDTDGQVTEDELKDHIKFMQKRYVEQDISRTWDAHKPEDGLLDWPEYRTAVYGKPGQEELEGDYELMMKRDEKRWGLADLDNNEKLNKTEYGCFMHPESCDHMKNVIVEETIADVDKNQDGVVDIEEYIDDMYRPAPEDQPGVEPDWVKSEREMFHTHRDKNKDGALNQEEMRDWIMPDGFDHAEAEARHLIAMADDNKDLHLSNDEIINHYDVFVGSQVTDYGEQLQRHDPGEL